MEKNLSNGQTDEFNKENSSHQNNINKQYDDLNNCINDLSCAINGLDANKSAENLNVANATNNNNSNNEIAMNGNGAVNQNAVAVNNNAVVKEENTNSVSVNSQPQSKQSSSFIESGAIESKFTGGAFALFGVNLLVMLGTMFTLGIAFPWLTCWKLRWFAEHTFVNGKQQTFDGTGGQLIGNYIKWMFFTIITLGIYSFWMVLNMQRWTTKHTHFKGEQGESKFDGKLIQLIGVGIGCALLIGFTLGIGTFWAHCWKQRWYTKHTIIDGQKLDFNGKGLQFLGSCIKWILLTIITFGIYSFWLVVKIEKWTVKHTFIKGAKGYKEIPPKPEGYSSALTLVICGLLGFILSPIVSLICAIMGVKKANQIKMKGLKVTGIIGIIISSLSLVGGLASVVMVYGTLLSTFTPPPDDSEIYAGHNGDPYGYYVKLSDADNSHYVLIDENFDGAIYISSDATVCYYYAQADTNPNDSVIYDIFSANINGYSTNFELDRNESGNVDYFDNSNSMSFSHNIPICMCHYGSGDDTIYLPASYADAILLPDGFTGTIYNY